MILVEVVKLVDRLTFHMLYIPLLMLVKEDFLVFFEQELCVGSDNKSFKSFKNCEFSEQVRVATEPSDSESSKQRVSLSTLAPEQRVSGVCLLGLLTLFAFILILAIIPVPGSG